MKLPQPSSAEVVASPQLWAAPNLPFLPTRQTRAQLAEYLDLLLVWNRRLNLTGARDSANLMADLVQDSFFLAQFLEGLAATMGWEDPLTLDIGAGAGLPGIPLRLFWQAGKYVMIERSQKRALFLKNVCARMRLERVSVAACEAQTYFAGAQPAQCILSRAFMPWPALAGFCYPGLAAGGMLIVMANEPMPQPFDSRWRYSASLAYKLPKKSRWLWALEKSA